MVITDQPASALGLALIALAGASAGFLAASVPTTTQSPDVGPIPPGEARMLDPAPERIDIASVGEGPTRLLVFDDEARYQRAIQLPASQDGTSLTLSGEPVILLVPAASTPLAIDLPANADPTVNQTPTHEIPRTLASEQGATVDEELTLTIPNRPSSLGLSIDGEADGLHVSVRTTEGPVLRQTNQSTDDEPGELRLDPDSLANGTYRVSVHADRLDGHIRLITRTLSIAGQLDSLSAPDDRIEQMGALVARVQQEQAWHVPTASTDELTLAIERGARADVHLYGPENRLLRSVELGEDGPDWRWGSNGSQEPVYDAVRIDAKSSTYTVHVDRIQADVDRVVYVLVPGQTDAQPGRLADLTTRTVEIPYASTPSTVQDETVRYAGGLVGVSVTDGSGAGVDRRVTVDSPQGVVLDRRDQVAADGTGLLTDRAQHVERFGPGPLEIQVEAEAASGSVQIAIEHYVP